MVGTCLNIFIPITIWLISCMPLAAMMTTNNANRTEHDQESIFLLSLRDVDLNISFVPEPPALPTYSKEVISQQVQGQSITYPIILMPSIAGSRLEYKGSGVIRSLGQTLFPGTCHRNFDWQLLWLNAWHFGFDTATECLVNDLKRHVTGSMTKDNRGITVRVPGWGRVNTLDYLDPSAFFRERTIQLEPLINYLKQLGYSDGNSLLGAPYDWRLAPYENPELFTRMRALVIDAYEKNGGKPVVLITHSTGGLQVLYFLQQELAEFKAKYIRSWVSVSTPFGGSMDALYTIISGNNFDRDEVDRKLVQQATSTFSSLFYLLPREEYWGTETLVTNNGKQYTWTNIQELFADANIGSGYTLMQATRNSLKPEIAPGVETYCIFGWGVSTKSRLDYHGDFRADPTIQWEDDGDGTVNFRSLEICRKWKWKQPQNVHLYIVKYLRHTKSILDSLVTDYIRDKVLVLTTTISSTTTTTTTTTTTITTNTTTTTTSSTTTTTTTIITTTTTTTTTATTATTTTITTITPIITKTRQTALVITTQVVSAETAVILGVILFTSIYVLSTAMLCSVLYHYRRRAINEAYSSVSESEVARH